MTAQPPRSPKFPLRLNQLAAVPMQRLPATPLTPFTQRAGPAVPAVRPLLRPQRPLAHAFADAARRDPASGLGLDSADVRRRMTLRLQEAGIRNPAVLAAMAQVERHRFVDAALVTQAYEDTSLPIGHGQTISKPSVVARMIELLLGGAKARAGLTPNSGLGRVLEIGTGCGYQAAVLSLLAQHVVSIERLKPLHDKARETVAPMRGDRLRLVFGDGMLGHAPNAPYDSIIAAAGGDELPLVWLDQLAVGGRLVAPLRRPGQTQQTLAVVDRSETGYRHSVCEVVNFVPLKSGLVR